LPTLVGNYALPDPDGQDKLHVTLNNGHLYLSGSFSVGHTYHFAIPESTELLPGAPLEFFTLATGETVFRFEKNDRGTIENCSIISGKDERQAKKIP
jgi:hypothetical protein